MILDCYGDSQKQSGCFKFNLLNLSIRNKHSEIIDGVQSFDTDTKDAMIMIGTSNKKSSSETAGPFLVNVNLEGCHPFDYVSKKTLLNKHELLNHTPLVQLKKLKEENKFSKIQEIVKDVKRKYQLI